MQLSPDNKVRYAVLPLDKEQFNHLDSIVLSSRIDEFFQENHRSQYGPESPQWDVTTATAILATSSIQALSEVSRRRALLLFFRAQFQVALCNRYGGIENHLVHSTGQSDTKWENPGVQITNAALRQGQIIAARVSFECLMEFIYLAEVGQLIPGSKSKFGTFRKWCCTPNNRFGWLVFYLFVVYRYDREHRTPEVHGTSYVAIEALRCDPWPRINSELDLQNVMLNVWPSILQTLNGESVSGFFCSRQDGLLFLEGFRSWKSLDLNAYWESQVKRERPLSGNSTV